MLFYFALAIASILAAALLLWLFRSLGEAGRSAFRGIFSGGNDRRRNARFAHLNSNLNETRSPWGWASAEGARRSTPYQGDLPRESGLQRRPGVNDPDTGGKAPWGWPGSDGLQAPGTGLVSTRTESAGPSASAANAPRAADAGDQAIDWPYRDEPKQKKPSQPRYSGSTGTGDRRDKPWGW